MTKFILLTVGTFTDDDLFRPVGTVVITEIINEVFKQFGPVNLAAVFLCIKSLLIGLGPLYIIYADDKWQCGMAN